MCVCVNVYAYTYVYLSIRSSIPAHTHTHTHTHTSVFFLAKGFDRTGLNAPPNVITTAKHFVLFADSTQTGTGTGSDAPPSGHYLADEGLWHHAAALAPGCRSRPARARAAPPFCIRLSSQYHLNPAPKS